MNRKIRVLIVDDSALVRKLFSRILQEAPDIDVVGTAIDPYDAREKIKKLNPDVLTLDVEMPKMDGITFLEKLMRLHPLPVVMVSTLTSKGADVTLRALELGAIDFINKPKIDLAHTIDQYASELISKVKVAALAKVSKRERTQQSIPKVEQKLAADVILNKASPQKHYITTDSIIVIGASTGGTEAIKEVLMALPPNAPGIVIAQHIPAAFSEAFAKRVDSLCSISVSEAVDGQRILQGHAYIAPGDQHLLIDRQGAFYRCVLNDGPPVNRHKPSVDVLYRSAAKNAGPNAVGVLLTGMGDDGARGLLEMQEAGSETIAQDEASSVVWGMPGSAVKIGAANQVLPLNRIAQAALESGKRRCAQKNVQKKAL